MALRLLCKWPRARAAGPCQLQPCRLLVPLAHTTGSGSFVEIVAGWASCRVARALPCRTPWSRRRCRGSRSLNSTDPVLSPFGLVKRLEAAFASAVLMLLLVESPSRVGVLASGLPRDVYLQTAAGGPNSDRFAKLPLQCLALLGFAFIAFPSPCETYHDTIALPKLMGAGSLDACVGCRGTMFALARSKCQ